MAYYNGQVMSGETVYRMFPDPAWPRGAWRNISYPGMHGISLPVLEATIWLHRNWGIPNG